MTPSSAEATVVETRRMRLRPPQADDVEPLHAIQGDAEAMRFTWCAPDREATHRHLERWGRTLASEGFAPWTALSKTDATVLGWGGLGRDPDDPRWGPEVVYFLRRGAWGRGLAAELVETALRVAFEQLDLAEVGAFVHPENAASRRVLEKCGFRRVEFVSGMERDRYAIRSDAWRQREDAPGTRRFSIASELAAPPEAVWRHATSPDGVNHELGPLLRMTFPGEPEDLTAAMRQGGSLGRCWLLLAGLVPVEFDDLTLVEVEPGRRFLERSTLLSQRLWQHERRIEATPGGSRVSDRIAFAPRIRWLGPVHALVFRAVFRWRHRRLRRRFRGRPA